ncbi:oligopeptide/dipeptide ABC transporter ATP-binding protein [Allostreptomyces psammosilenae]|uniref:Peptide/nickel transport system ATP-binding protein n=1 Tax=Allostreptomyces psammosilenae TaxID=1892865 RepID=A0A852ZR56_9ACTN|nr:ABC transporter ATP-binding protein [Allostreptomyces psammosilenae]NYI03977.1 peptide/nickel transport system ATP-binding protein [Allostreptomyces psammosilenae]
MPTKPESPDTTPAPPAGGPDRAAAATGTTGPAGAAAEALIEVDDLSVHFAIRNGALQRLGIGDSGAVRAVDGVSLTLRRGEVLGLVGESGSGKTTLGRALLGLTRATSGSIRYDGQDLTRLPERRLRPLRRRLQMVFQDPHAALNPAMDIRTAVGHPLRIHGLAAPGPELDARVVDALERVGLSPAEQFLDKYPADLSGGQKQRVVLARAIIAGPELLVADEPISMLDMSVRAKILQLMLDLRRDLDLTYVYVTHDLASAKYFCDRIAIMYLGRIVEIGPTEQVFAEPRHPYTRALLAAVPEPDPARAVPRDLPRGEIPDAAHPPRGCSFHPRCPVAFERCGWEGRDLRALLERRWLQVPAEQYRAERALFADPDRIGTPPRGTRGEELSCDVAPARGHTAEELLALLRRVREEDSAREPREPFWRGVTGVREVEGRVRVEFAPAEEPELLPLAGHRTACHLHR